MEITLNNYDDQSDVGLLLGGVLMIIAQLNIAFYNIAMSRNIKIPKQVQYLLIPVIILMLIFLLYNVWQLKNNNNSNKVAGSIIYSLLGFTEESPIPDNLLALLGKILCLGVLISFVFPVYGLLKDPVSEKITL